MTEAGVSLGHLPRGPDLAPARMTHVSPQGPGGEREPLLPLPGLADGLLAEGNGGGWGRLGALQPLHSSDAQPPFCRSTLPR